MKIWKIPIIIGLVEFAVVRLLIGRTIQDGFIAFGAMIALILIGVCLHEMIERKSKDKSVVTR